MFSFFPGITALCYSNQSHGTALFILMLIQKFQMFGDRYWSPLQSRALHTQSFKEIQPISHVLTVLLPSHTWMCFNSQKGNKRWSELKWKLWMLWLSLSHPDITSIYPVIYLERPITYRSQQADNEVRKSHIENRHTFLKVKINHWRRTREVTSCLQIRKHFLLSKT